MPKRAARGRATCGIQSIQWCGERTDVISARVFNLANHVYSHAANTRKRNVSFNFMKLSAQGGLHYALNIAQGSSGYVYRTHFGQSKPSGTIHYPLQSLRHATPNVDIDAIAGAKNVVGAGWQIHREIVEVPGSIAEDVGAEMFQYRSPWGYLRIQIVQRWNIRIRIGVPSNLR